MTRAALYKRLARQAADIRSTIDRISFLEEQQDKPTAAEVVPALLITGNENAIHNRVTILPKVNPIDQHVRNVVVKLLIAAGCKQRGGRFGI